MKIYNEWMTDSEYFNGDYPNNKLLDDAKLRFEKQKTSLEGKDVIIINSEETFQERIVVQNHTNPLNSSKYDKKLSFNIDSKIKEGSILKFDDKTWLIVSTIFDKMAYKVGSVLECKNTLLVNKNDILSHIPYVVFDNVSMTRMGTSENKYLVEPNSKMTIMIPDTTISRQIKRNDLFDLYSVDDIKDTYKVIDINRSRKQGLIILELEWCAENQDNPNYTIEILNGDNIQIAESQSLTLNVGVYSNGELLTSPLPYSFISSDKTIATVDSNGIITFLSVGNVNITVKLDSNNVIQDTISIEVIADLIENKTVQIFGSTNIIKNYTEDYNCIFKNNGSVIIENSVFYLKADDGVSSTNLAEIVSQDNINNIVIIKGLNLGYVKLFVKNNDNSIVSDAYRIKIENLF